jgi:hypothetical protein
VGWTIYGTSAAGGEPSLEAAQAAFKSRFEQLRGKLTRENPGAIYIRGMSNRYVPPPPDDPPDPSTLTLAELCDRLEGFELECPGGPLENVVEWIELRRRLGACLLHVLSAACWHLRTWRIYEYTRMQEAFERERLR